MKKLLPHLPLFILLMTFVAVKIPYLSLPYFWDEAWVYGPAVKAMAENGPSLAPDAIAPELGRGHPLLFHFLGSAWIILFGETLFSTHCFALTVSLLFLICVYNFLFRKYGTLTAFFSVLLICVQPVFFTQSVLVLPEIMLAFFCIVALFSYSSGNYFYYSIFAVLAILTKESAIVLFVAVSIHEIFFAGQKRSHILKQLILLNLPVTAWLLFLTWQKSIYGWWLFPEHTGSVSLDPPALFRKLENYFSYLFIYQGRNILSILLLISITLFILFRNKLINEEKNLFRITLLFTFFFLFFSSINFFSNRYIISLIFLFCICTPILVMRLQIGLFMRIFLILLPVISGGWNTYSSKTINDHNPGYSDAVECTRKTIQFVVDDAYLRNKNIYTTFLTASAFKDSRQGYVLKKDELQHVSNTTPDNAGLIILNNFEQNANFNIDTAPGKLIYECICNNATVKIFLPDRTNQ